MKYKVRFVYIVEIMLTITCIFLTLFPIKTEAAAYVYTRELEASLEMRDGDTIKQHFISTVYDLEAIIFDMPIEENKDLVGTLEVKIRDNDRVVEQQVLDLREISHMVFSVEFPVLNDSYKNTYQLEITYYGPDVLTLYQSRSDTDNYFEYNSVKTGNNSAFRYKGKENNYFYVWYPFFTILLIYTIDSIKEERGAM
jgi:hypothetical protein